MEEIKIEKDIPVPSILQKADPKQSPLWPMEVNDSFVAPVSDKGTWYTRTTRFKQRTGRVFTVRKLNDKEIRVWRIK